MSIVVIGSINTDLTIQVPHFAARGETILGDGDFTTSQGGKGANQAVAAAAGGTPVYMVGKVGADAFGDRAVADLEASRVDCTHVVIAQEQATGIAAIFVDPQGDNSITVAPGANSRISTVDVQGVSDLIASADILMLQLEIPVAAVNEAIRIARECSTAIILDPAPATATLPDLDGVDFLTPNENEAHTLTGISCFEEDGPKRIVRAFRDKGVRNIALTLGDKGCYIAGTHGECHLDAPVVDAVDSTGAGDAFNGFLATALVRDFSFKEAAKIASTAASLSVTRPGARSNLPSWSEVQTFLSD